jgi:molybdopterin converting factor small subunit
LIKYEVASTTTVSSNIKNNKITTLLNINVMLFGNITDITGTQSLVLSNVASTYELKSQMGKLYPALNDIIYSVAVNKHIVQEDTTLEDGDTVALLPPFSGG